MNSVLTDVVNASNLENDIRYFGDRQARNERIRWFPDRSLMTLSYFGLIQECSRYTTLEGLEIYVSLSQKGREVYDSLKG